MMTEDEKWHELYDDEEYIELLKLEGWTPESSSGMSTEDIERERDLRIYRQENWGSGEDSAGYALMKIFVGVGALFGIGYAGYRLVKFGCRKVKSVIENHKNKKDEEL